MNTTMPLGFDEVSTLAAGFPFAVLVRTPDGRHALANVSEDCQTVRLFELEADDAAQILRDSLYALAWTVDGLGTCWARTERGFPAPPMGRMPTPDHVTACPELQNHGQEIIHRLSFGRDPEAHSPVVALLGRAALDALG